MVIQVVWFFLFYLSEVEFLSRSIIIFVSFDEKHWKDKFLYILCSSQYCEIPFVDSLLRHHLHHLPPPTFTSTLTNAFLIMSIPLPPSNSTRIQHPLTVQYQPISMEQAEDESLQAPSVNLRQRLVGSFWILGLLNNTSYVIMIASAKSISEGGTGLVFLANVVPSLAIKLSAPYWFDKVSYRIRLQAAAMAMVISFGLVASMTSTTGKKDPSTFTFPLITLLLQLLGVAFGSAQCGLGEASLLAMAGKVDGDNPNTKQGQCLTAFSSGTGMAGVFGFFWKWFWNDWLRFSLSTTLWLALVLAVAYWSMFQYAQRQQELLEIRLTPRSSTISDAEVPQQHEQQLQQQQPKQQQQKGGQAILSAESQSLTLPTPERGAVLRIADMSSTERFQLVLSLWPYMIPLFVVYAAEYALQSGTWTAIGFPLESIEARDRFYEYSNWMYQAGVFISRSSGTVFTSPMVILWLMPALQFVNLGLYTYVASHPTSLLYQPWILYTGALYTGLLGGGVYIHGYKRICLDLPLEHREFSLSATSVAEGIGVVVADAAGLVIQSCLYQVNHLSGALVACPIRSWQR